MTHAEKAQRRAQIAKAVQDGMEIPEAACHFGVCLEYARSVCKENGVHVERRIAETASTTMDILADLQNTDRTIRDIAAERHISWQRVEQVLAKARKAGVLFPGRKQNKKRAG